MPLDHPYNPPAARPHKPFLAILIVAVALAATAWALGESRRLAMAKDALPAQCISELMALNDHDARTRGVALGECFSHKGVSDLRTEIEGRWIYGPSDSPVDGIVVHVWRTLPERGVSDMLIHVSAEENRLYLNDVFARGEGCAGSVSDVQISDGTFSHTINMTPEAILLFGGSARLRSGYHTGDVANGSRDCYGKMVFNARRPVMLQLKADAAAEGTYPQQACFDSLVARYVKEGKIALDINTEYPLFLRAYSMECQSSSAKLMSTPPETGASTGARTGDGASTGIRHGKPRATINGEHYNDR